MAAEILTFRDCVEMLLDQLDVPFSPRNQRLGRQAVLAAYRRLPNVTRWRCLERRAKLRTSASQTDGTISYDHTGGAYERMVTLDGATWPADAAEGRVVISDVAYDVDRRISDTVLTLTEISNPGADIAVGTSYTWCRPTYLLPPDFRRMAHIYDAEDLSELPVVTTDAQHKLSVSVSDSPDTPWQVAIRGTGDTVGRLSIEFMPPPSSAVVYDYIYEASPRALLIEKYATGTVTTSGTDVTGTDTVFPSSCVGSLIRFGTASQEPTSVAGGYDSSGAWIDNPYAHQAVIIARGGDTSLVISQAPSADLTGVKYTISDPIDFVLPAMLNAFLRLAEADFARLVGHKLAQVKDAEAMRELKLAMEANELHSYAPVAVTVSPRITITDDDS